MKTKSQKEQLVKEWDENPSYPLVPFLKFALLTKVGVFEA